MKSDTRYYMKESIDKNGKRTGHYRIMRETDNFETTFGERNRYELLAISYNKKFAEEILKALVKN